MGRNKDELIKLAEKITGQECKDVLTKKDALKKIACHYLGEEKEFASIADCLECIVEYGASGGDTYAHKVEMKFDNFSLTYYGNGELLTSNLRNFENFANEYPEVTVSGDLSELLNFYPILLSKSANQNEYTKDKKCSYHIYLKDEDTDLLNTIERMIVSQNVRVIVIDNLMTMINKTRVKGSKLEAQSEVSNALEDMARFYNVCIILVAHKRKDSGIDDEDMLHGRDPP